MRGPWTPGGDTLAQAHLCCAESGMGAAALHAVNGASATVDVRVCGRCGGMIARSKWDPLGLHDCLFPF